MLISYLLCSAKLKGSISLLVNKQIRLFGFARQYCFTSQTIRVPKKTRRWDVAGLLLGQRRRRWPNINLTSGQRLVFHVVEKEVRFPKAKLDQENLLGMVRWMRRHCSPDTGFENRTLAQYWILSGEETFGFFETWMPERGTKPRSPAFQAGSFNHRLHQGPRCGPTFQVQLLAPWLICAQRWS